MTDEDMNAARDCARALSMGNDSLVATTYTRLTFRLGGTPLVGHDGIGTMLRGLDLRSDVMFMERPNDQSVRIYVQRGVPERRVREVLARFGY